MRIRVICRTGASLGLICLAARLQAGEWEIGGAIAVHYGSYGSINSNEQYPTSPYTIVSSSQKGAWTQGGLDLGYEAFRAGQWGVRLQAQYTQSLVHPEIHHSGENVAAGSTLSEVFNGTASYKALALSLGVARTFSFGELGVSAGPRSNDLSVEGRVQNRSNSNFTFANYSVSHTYRDTYVTVNFAMTQQQQGFRSFQKVSLGFGLGSSTPAVNPGPSDWRMSEAYLAQFRPKSEIRILLGVRL